MDRVGIIFIFLLFSMGMAMGQSSRYKRADQLYHQHEYVKAIEWYEYTLKKEKSTPPTLALENLSTSYYAIRQYKKAESWMAKMAKKSDVSSDALFRYGKVLLINGKPEQAREQFLKVEGQENYVQWIDALLSESVDSTDWQATKLPINSRETDFGPAFWGKGLIFASQRNNSVAGVVHTSRTNDSPLLNLYYTEPKNSERWTRPQPLPGNVNSKLHDGPAQVGPEGNYLYVNQSRKIHKSNRRESKSGPLTGILIFENKNDHWKSPRSAQLPDLPVSYLHPCVSPDGNWLYFASDLPGGEGGLDLYKVYMNGDNWETPVNLGPSVNTPHDEAFPFVHSDGTLYFASEGHPGFGGWDLFQSDPRSTGWSIPSNLGEPLNSRWDDLSLIMDSSKTTCYFASNRGRNSRKDHIYRATREAPIFQDCPEQKTASFCYRFYEQGMEESLPYQLRYQWDFGDGQTALGIRAKHCFASPGVYTISLNVIDSLSGGNMFNEATYQLEVTQPEGPFVQFSPNPEDPLLFHLDATQSYLPSLSVGSWHWEFGDGTFATGETVDHRFPGPGNWQVQLGAVSQSDSSGKRQTPCVVKTITIKQQDVPGLNIPLYASTENQVNPDWTSTKSDRSVGSTQTAPTAEANIGPVRKQPESLTVEGLIKMPGPQERSGLIVWKDRENGDIIRETHSVFGDGSFITHLPTGRYYQCEITFPGYQPLQSPLDLREYFGDEKLDMTFNLILNEK